MSPWLALIIGLWTGFFLGIVAVALAQMAKDPPGKPRLGGLGYWDGSDEQVVFTPDGDWKQAIPVRRSIYDWRSEEG